MLSDRLSVMDARYWGPIRDRTDAIMLNAMPSAMSFLYGPMYLRNASMAVFRSLGFSALVQLGPPGGIRLPPRAATWRSPRTGGRCA